MLVRTMYQLKVTGMSAMIIIFTIKSNRINPCRISHPSYLIDNPTQVGNLTIRELAQANFVSTTTIMRLCQKLGFLVIVSWFTANSCYLQLKKPSTESDENEVAEPLLLISFFRRTI